MQHLRNWGTPDNAAVFDIRPDAECIEIPDNGDFEGNSLRNKKKLKGEREVIATRTTFLLSASLFFTFWTSNFQTLFVLRNFILWSGSFLKIPSGKRIIFEKPPKNAFIIIAPCTFIVLSILLTLCTPLLHTQAQNTLLQNFQFRSRSRDMDKNPPKTLFYPTRSALMKHNFFVGRN